MLWRAPEGPYARGQAGEQGAWVGNAVLSSNRAWKALNPFHLSYLGRRSLADAVQCVHCCQHEVLSVLACSVGSAIEPALGGLVIIQT